MYTNGGYIIYRHWLKCSDIQSSVAVPAPVHCNASETRSPEVFIKWSSIRYDVLEDYNETNRTEKAKRANDSTSDENGSQNWMPWIRSENYFERRKKKDIEIADSLAKCRLCLSSLGQLLARLCSVRGLTCSRNNRWDWKKEKKKKSCAINEGHVMTVRQLQCVTLTCNGKQANRRADIWNLS